MGDTNNSKPVAAKKPRKYVADWRIPHRRSVEPRDIPTLEEAKAIIDRLYESGVPFFTKELIQDMWDQTKREPTPDKIITKDITGATVRCNVEMGRVCRMRDAEDDTELMYVCKDLALNYNCRAHLTNEIDRRHFSLSHWEPCSVIIMHKTQKLDPKTKEIVPQRGPLDREVVAKIFHDKTQEWKESPACEKLKTILSSSAKDHEINKVVAFALGTMSFQHFNEEGILDTSYGWRSAFQNALLVTITEWLKERDHKEKVPCYSQDPAQSEVDKEILDEVGIEVVDDPRGWLEVDEQSVVFSVAPNVPVKEIITDIARPAIIIWCRVKFLDGLDQRCTDPDSSRVRAMMEGYELYEFGPDQNIFCDLAIYIRKLVAAPTPSDGRFS